jgi:hypothetical protein
MIFFSRLFVILKLKLNFEKTVAWHSCLRVLGRNGVSQSMFAFDAKYDILQMSLTIFFSGPHYKYFWETPTTNIFWQALAAKIFAGGYGLFWQVLFLEQKL